MTRTLSWKEDGDWGRAGHRQGVARQAADSPFRPTAAARPCLLCSRVRLTIFRSGCPKVQLAFCFSVAFILKGGRRGAEKEELYLRVSSMLRLKVLTKFNFVACFLGASEWITISCAAGWGGSVAESWQTKGSDTSGAKSVLVSLECYSRGAPLNSCQGPFALCDALPFCYISYGFQQWPLLTQGIFFKRNFSI